MQALRTVVNSDALERIIPIPENMKHKKVELIILPVETGSGIPNGDDLNAIIGKIKKLPVDPLVFQKEIRNEW